jgi:hypothetical protein
MAVGIIHMHAQATEDFTHETFAGSDAACDPDLQRFFQTF